MLTFSWPWMLLLLPAPWLLRRWNKARVDNQQPTINFPNLSQLKVAFAENKSHTKISNWQNIIRQAAWLCLIIGLMRPEIVNQYAQANCTGYDLMLAVDISPSMDNADLVSKNQLISRINATKQVVSNFIKQRSGDRIGLIVFAQQAVLAIPLTQDGNSVIKMLKNLMIGMAGDSTAIGDAIGIGVQNLRQRPAKSRALILLTDGADVASSIPPLEAAKIAAAEGIKIYTIGVGDRLDDKLLSEIANLTRGIYAKVASVDALEKVYNEINQLEKSDFKQAATLVRSPLYQIFISIALLCIVSLLVANSRASGFGHELT